MYKIFSKIVLRFCGLIPDWLLYILSNGLAFLLQKVLKYRLSVVKKNLRNSFPKANTSYLREIEKKFYLNFSDVLLENLKLYSLSKSTLHKKMKLVNPGIFEQLEKENKGAILIGAHYNNWEWMALALSSYIKQDLFSVYKPLNNTTINELMLTIRTRFGAHIIPMKKFPKVVLKNKNRATVNLMLADQSPHKSKLDYYADFLNQDTPVYLGAEKLMKAAKLQLLFVEVKRVKRGFYEMKIIPLNSPKDDKLGDSTKQHLNQLEKMILNEPQNWLWSHKRWKHSRKK